MNFTQTTQVLNDASLRPPSHAPPSHQARCSHLAEQTCADGEESVEERGNHPPPEDLKGPGGQHENPWPHSQPTGTEYPKRLHKDSVNVSGPRWSGVRREDKGCDLL